ncbi:MAG: hypothetical protein QM484_14585 [Woeseiaceae bacterium]
MTDSWKDDNCAAMKAHYAIYSIPHAAALWCGVDDDLIEQVLAEVTQVSPTGFGRSVWKHPDAPCVEPRSRAIAEAIEAGGLPHGREDAQTLGEGDYAAYERRHIFGRDLKIWMGKAFPNEKPAFLFDDIEQNSHTSISADSYRVLKAERDSLKKRVEKAVEEFKSIRKEKSVVEAELKLLKETIQSTGLSNNSVEGNDLSNSASWVELNHLVEIAVKEYPNWRSNQRKVQKSGNLQEWLTSSDIGASNREAELIKKIMSDFFQELR